MSEQELPDVDPSVPPSGQGCEECLDRPDGWWVHLRRCAACGHIGCCDSSPAQHATAHYRTTGHPIMTSFEPGESWSWDFRTEAIIKNGPELSPPTSRPTSQGAPAPAARVPENWMELIHR